MTIRVERTFEINASAGDVWDFIADPSNRADAISVVKDWKTEGDEFIWIVSIPIPFVNQSISVRTRETKRIDGERVEFIGSSSVMQVTGKHVLTEIEGGKTRVSNEFEVDGRIPGVERFFKRNLDKELGNLQQALITALE